MAVVEKAGARRELAATIAASKAPAISRAAAVLRLLGKSERPLGLQAIADELGLVPSTCLYVLRALAAEELVAFEPETKRYALEAGVLTLARQWLRRNKFSNLAQPFLDKISQRFDITTVGVHVVGLQHMVVVAVSEAAQNFRLSAQIGSRFPALISATGRCVAAFGNHADAEIRKRFDKLRWDDPPSFEEWMRQVELTRQQGFAVDDGNYISGVTVVAAPVAGAGQQLSHVLVALGVSGVMKRAGMPRVEQEMLGAARRLSRQISGEGSLRFE